MSGTVRSPSMRLCSINPMLGGRVSDTKHMLRSLMAPLDTLILRKKWRLRRLPYILLGRRTTASPE